MFAGTCDGATALSPTGKERLPRAVWSEALSPALGPVRCLPGLFGVHGNTESCAAARDCFPGLVSDPSRSRATYPPALLRGAAELLGALGEDVRAWTPQALRTFLLDRAKQCGAETTQKLITSLRAFLRYLSFRGEAQPDLDLAIPAIAHWRLASLPRCLSAKELELLIAACDGNTQTRLRDRAIVLLLSRLGLRAGDVAQLRFAEINWENGTLQVMGKGRYQVRLPLPQDVGDALLRYLECRPQVDHTDRIFLRSIAPFRPFISAHCFRRGQAGP